jgi:V/A-type H+-transporting ATPase subunit E
MNAEQVVEKILSQAREEAEKINAKAKEKLDHQQEDLTKKLDEYRDQTQHLAGQAAEDKRLRLLAAARLELRKEILATKRRLLEEVFTSAGRKLTEMGDDEYRELMRKLIAKAAQTGDEEIIIGRNENRINAELVEQVNNQLGSNNKGNLKLSENKGNFDTGFVLKRGKVKVNATLPVLLAQARESLEIELAKELFAGS